MIHVRTDNESENSKRRFACGIGPDLPPGDLYLFASESHKAGVYFATHPEAEPCPGCFPEGKPRFGTPLSELSGRPGAQRVRGVQADRSIVGVRLTTPRRRPAPPGRRTRAMGEAAMTERLVTLNNRLYAAWLRFVRAGRDGDAKRLMRAWIAWADAKVRESRKENRR